MLHIAAWVLGSVCSHLYNSHVQLWLCKICSSWEDCYLTKSFINVGYTFVFRFLSFSIFIVQISELFFIKIIWVLCDILNWTVDSFFSQTDLSAKEKVIEDMRLTLEEQEQTQVEQDRVLEAKLEEADCLAKGKVRLLSKLTFLL